MSNPSKFATSNTKKAEEKYGLNVEDLLGDDDDEDDDGDEGEDGLDLSEEEDLEKFYKENGFNSIKSN